MRGLTIAGALIAVIALAASCATPTSLTVDVYSDVPCAAHAPAALVMAKSLPELGASAPSAASMRCEADGNLGSVVISPGGAKDGAIALALMLRPDGQPADACLDAKNAPGCIVAKRQLRFEPRTETRMRVDLRLSCLGVVCADGETCARGTCIKADIDCGASCDEETLVAQSGVALGPPTDAGALGDGRASLDAGAVDGALPDSAVSGASHPLSPLGPFAATELAIGLGVDHACVLYPSGDVGCWGANDVGQLGDGTTTPRPDPSRSVAGITGAIAIASGNKWSCALLGDGRVACWGANDRGQLGDGTTDPFASSPRYVAGLTGMTVLAAGDAHGCAGRPTATTPDVYCWGSNDHGQAGSANGVVVRTPVSSFIDSGTSTALVVGAGVGHTCVGAGGKLFCWGDNAAGQLGTGDLAPRTAPSAIQLPQAASPIRLGLGRTSSCALGVFGAGNTHGLSCWGSNAFGELGLNNKTPSEIPMALGVITVGSFGGDAGTVFTTYTPNTVSVGDFHACQLATPTQIACWGRNDVGQLGTAPSADKLTQSPVQTLTGVTSVSTRGSSTCVVGSFGVRCFGALSATFATATL